MKKYIISALLLASLALPTLNAAMKITNDFIRNIVVLTVSKDGHSDVAVLKWKESKTFDVDSKKTAVLDIAAGDIFKDTGGFLAGTRVNWYQCKHSDDFILRQFRGSDLDAKQIKVNYFVTSLNPKPGRTDPEVEIVR